MLLGASLLLVVKYFTPKIIEFDQLSFISVFGLVRQFYFKLCTTQLLLYCLHNNILQLGSIFALLFYIDRDIYSGTFFQVRLTTSLSQTYSRYNEVFLLLVAYEIRHILSKSCRIFCIGSKLKLPIVKREKRIMTILEGLKS